MGNHFLESKLDVSVIIVNWNTRDILRDCLISVYSQTKDISFEVIVVDNASMDGSSLMVKAQFPDVKLIENSENRGFAAANNQGMAVARGRYVLLLNSDTVVLKNAIAKTVKYADLNPDTAVVGCRVLNPDRSLQPTCFMFPSILNMILSSTYLYKLFPRSTFFGRERMSWWDRSDAREVDVVTGCFMLVRSKAINEVGMMDESFFLYGEETDWCYRFRQSGWKVMFAPVAEIIHLGGESSKQARADMLVQLRQSRLAFMKKHYGWCTHKLACVAVIIFFLLRLPVWLCRALISSKKRREALVKLHAYSVGIGKTLRVFLMPSRP